MLTRQMKLSDTLPLHDEGGIVLVKVDEFSPLYRLQEYRQMVNPVMISCKLEFSGSYKRVHLNINTQCVVVTGN